MSTALILGCGECVWEDAAEALSMFTPDAVFAVKDMMMLWPLRIDYGVTLHPERTDGYMRNRRHHGLGTDFEIWAHRNISGAVVHRTTPDWAGSSGLFAIKIAIEQGFDCIVLAGVPMTKKFGHVTRQKEWVQASLFLKGWMKRTSEIAPFVRSMSGWTKETFGAPTSEWLMSKGADASNPDMVSVIRQRCVELEIN